ncbi:uncharacterized protein LOC114272898 [Camellia sinensis]|uniref:uncharacterized protein LOC114272898 n=1 Tax=Camellia sinensis TaxID=4442 RepID=UPI00103581F6|nr:uncharacterized protein LOC114272898 [Camellia sinensis]
MEGFGFHSKWIQWVKECITTVSLSILVNGSSSDSFNPQKGLRQGDLLSPFLFIIEAEILNVMFIRATQLGLLKGVQVETICLTHLQFADDTIIFYQAKWVEIVNIRRILRCFEIISRLKVDFHNSLVGGVGIDNALLNEFAAALRCKVQKLPMKFLGLPLGANPRLRRI